MQPHNLDPPALRSVAIFNLTKKVNSSAEMAEALELITAPLWSRFEHHRFLSGTSKNADSAMMHSVGVDGEVFILGICAQEPVSYEWTITIDRMPPLWKRLFGLPPAPLRDTPATRRLLGAIDEGLRSDANFSQISWHKKEILSHRNLSSAADSPL
jgi:hypothetical protein